MVEILVLLPSEDLVNCLQVSSTWRQLVSSFRRLWTQRCLDGGLPDYYLCEEVCASPVALFLATRKQRRYIAAYKHKVYPDVRSGEPEGSSFKDVAEHSGTDSADFDGRISVHPRQVVYAGSGILIVVMFGPRKGKEQDGFTSERVGEGSKSSMRMSFTTYKELKQRYQFEYIIVERLKERGAKTEEIRRVALEDKWKWPVIIYSSFCSQ